jgi:hypothetical protein
MPTREVLGLRTWVSASGGCVGGVHAQPFRVEQLTFMKEYLSIQDIEAANEETVTHTLDNLDPNSENVFLHEG